MVDQAVRNFLVLLSYDDEKLEPLKKEVESANNFEKIVVLASQLNTDGNEWFQKDGILLNPSDFVFTVEDLKNVLKELIKDKDDYANVLNQLDFHRVNAQLEGLKYFSPELLEELKIE